MDQHLCFQTYPIFNLKPATVVAKLTEQQYKYAYHLSLAAVAGSPILFKQIWAQSEPIFAFLESYVLPFVEDPGLYQKVADSANSAQKQLHEYIGQVFYQGGPFLGFGDTKFIPRCSQAEIEGYLAKLAGYDQRFANVSPLFDAAKELMYSVQETHVGFPPNGQTWYFSPNMDKEEAEEFNQFMTRLDILKENSCVRLENGVYYIVHASVEKAPDRELPERFRGQKVVMRYGNFSRELKIASKHIENAIPFAQTETQKAMLRELLRFYATGDMAHHIEYSKLWVQDTDPAVETYQGFIETYRDPTGVRAEFEAFVACVDPDSSRQLGQLLQPDNCKRILSALPMPAFLQRDTFNPPTYKAIDIIVFPTSGLPIGINIPNYDCIRQGFGFKNVSLQNVMSARETKLSEIQYIPDDIKPSLVEFDALVLKAEVASHELFGHGSGSLLYKEDYERLSEEQKRELNAESYYLANETFYGKFGDLQSTFEECRAEVSAFYLTFDDLVSEIFQFPPAHLQRVRLVATYDVFLAGITSLIQFKDGKWLQAHSHARYSIIRYVMERTDAAQVHVTENASNLQIRIDENRLGEIVQAYAEMIRELNLIKASADVEAGRRLFGRLGAVDGKWAEVRRIASERRKPRAAFIGAVLTNHAIDDWRGPEMNGLEVGVVSVQNMKSAGIL